MSLGHTRGHMDVQGVQYSAVIFLLQGNARVNRVRPQVTTKQLS